MKSAYLIALALLSTLDVASAAWQKLPATGAPPMNLASRAIVGTKIASASGISNTQALLADDPSQFAKIPAGSSSAVIDISEQTLVEFVSFINDGGAGKVSVSASTNNTNWVALSQQAFDASTLLVELNFAGIQAKYVKFSFDLSNSGSVSSVKVLGASKESDYRTFHKGSGGVTTEVSSSKPIYMFPTPTNLGELGSGQGTYKFPISNEKYRTVIYDLGDPRTLKKFNAAYSKVPTRVEIFAFEQLPEKRDWRGKTTFEPSILETMQPIASGEDASGVGHLSLVSSKAVTAKYIVMRFEPNYSKKVAGLNVEWQSMASAALIPFSGMANQLGLFNLAPAWQSVAADAGNGGFVVLNTSFSDGSGNAEVHISNSAIAKMKQQMGAGTTETQAINAILNNNGFASVPGGAQQPGQGGSNGNNGSSGEDAADAALNNNSLPPFTGGAYRGGSGGGGGGLGTGRNNVPTPSGGGGNTGARGPIVIITQTVNPTTP
ncbi:MAG: hypothetical protein RL693_1928 [Verrucomicrobiota bacterium]|jgi:hypothetical protein